MRNWRPEETPSFTPSEMACKCGKCGGVADMDHDFMTKLQMMRNLLGPLEITSGYRCPSHPDEIRKPAPGAHAQGKAADILAKGAAHRFRLISGAVNVGMVGLGVAKSFIHVDSGNDNVDRPASWSY